MSHKFPSLLNCSGTTVTTTTIATVTPRKPKTIAKGMIFSLYLFNILFMFSFVIHRGMLHCLQWSLHSSKECFWHFGLIILFLNGTTLCFFDLSSRCSISQFLHKCLSQMLQCKDGSGVSQRWHRATSWKLQSTSMLVDGHFHPYQRWMSGRKDIYTLIYFGMFYT